MRDTERIIHSKKEKEKVEQGKIRGEIQWASSPFGTASTFTTLTSMSTMLDTPLAMAP